MLLRPSTGAAEAAACRRLLRLAIDVPDGWETLFAFLADDLVDRDASRRFQDEARLASGLNHPHIVTVFETGTFGAYEYLVTELIEGPTLRDWARQNRGWRRSSGRGSGSSPVSRRIGLSAGTDISTLSRRSCIMA